MDRRSDQMMLDLGPTERPASIRSRHGEVFTRRWIAELILDLAGYTSDRDLAGMVAVEPSCGAGAFLEPMVDRLLASVAGHSWRIEDAESAIHASDLRTGNVARSQDRVKAQLVRFGLAPSRSESLARRWIKQGDFLLHPSEQGSADFVLRNPPYIRLEDLPAGLSDTYRAACPTMRGRSDIFVGFIERGLRLLKLDGALGFIVADRWMRNQYGAELRRFVADNFAVEAVIEMHDVDAFEVPVSAYPALTVIRRAPQAEAVVASTDRSFSEPDAERLKRWVTAGSAGPLASTSVHAARLPSWFTGDGSWPSGTPDQLALVADLERRCPPLEDPATGTRVGIGLATGADDIFLTRDSSVVEPERLLPMAMARDVRRGGIAWSGTYLVNPWDDGGLVTLDDWPRLQEFLEIHGRRVRARHTARQSPARWHRTIDRMIPGLRQQAKLLFPEMKASAEPVLEEGHLYPHHNLYHVTSSGWDLEVLGGLLLSGVANLFVGTYCVKMRGGCYRFQAQYLRRIRVPAIDSVKRSDRKALAEAFHQRDVGRSTGLAIQLYGLDVGADVLRAAAPALA